MSADETLNYILKNRVSVSRYGDGELGIMRNYNIGFQQSTTELKRRLTEIASTPSQRHICCIPYPIAKIESNLKKQSKVWWINQVGLLYWMWNSYFKKQQILGDTQISRFYIDYKTDENATRLINLWDKIWGNRDILIVEGRNTRLGVGNDLFNKVRSIKRILCPETNAFSVYKDILDTVVKYTDKYNSSLSTMGGVIY